MTIPVEGLDLQIGVHPSVVRAIAQERWSEARQALRAAQEETGAVRYHGDGIRVVAVESWARPFKELPLKMNAAYGPVADHSNTPIEIRSPAESSISSSRRSGSGESCLAIASSSSVVSPIAETTTTS